MHHASRATPFRIVALLAGVVFILTPAAFVYRRGAERVLYSDLALGPDSVVIRTVHRGPHPPSWEEVSANPDIARLIRRGYQLKRIDGEMSQERTFLQTPIGFGTPVDSLTVTERSTPGAPIQTYRTTFVWVRGLPLASYLFWSVVTDASGTLEGSRTSNLLPDDCGC